MALTSNVWSVIVFHPFSNAAWTGYTPPIPDLPSVLVDAVVNAISLKVMPLGVGGGQAYIIADGMSSPVLLETATINTDSSQTTDVTTMDDGDVWYSMRDSFTGAWLRYEQNANRVYTLANPVPLGVFLS